MLRQGEARTQAEQAQVVVARLHGGPFDGWEDWIYRVRTDYLRRVHRGRMGRMLRRPPRYAWYQLDKVGEDGADYVFRGIRSGPPPRERREAGGAPPRRVLDVG